MSERLKEFFKKIHDKKNKIPEYASIVIRPGHKILDFKIKKMSSNILKIMAHDDKQKGWFLHSYHIPVKNLGLDEGAKNKEILPYLNEPELITSDSATQELVDEIIRKYLEVLAERKKHHFRTERFKKKKEFRTGTQMKGF